MLNLLSKIKEGCHSEGIDLIHSGINGDAIKLACTINGRRDTEVNAYIIPDGDSFNFYTITPSGDKSTPVTIAESEIIPTLLSAVNPEAPKVEISPLDTPTEKTDIVTIEVEDGVFDTKEVRHNTYKNSRYAYSNKYHKLGAIVDIKVKE